MSLTARVLQVTDRGSKVSGWPVVRAPNTSMWCRLTDSQGVRDLVPEVRGWSLSLWLCSDGRSGGCLPPVAVEALPVTAVHFRGT